MMVGCFLEMINWSIISIKKGKTGYKIVTYKQIISFSVKNFLHNAAL